MLGIFACDQDHPFGMGHRQERTVEGVFIHDDDAHLALVRILDTCHVPGPAADERIA
jgi:hypothetical protein